MERKEIGHVAPARKLKANWFCAQTGKQWKPMVNYELPLLKRTNTEKTLPAAPSLPGPNCAKPFSVFIKLKSPFVGANSVRACSDCLTLTQLTRLGEPKRILLADVPCFCSIKWRAKVAWLLAGRDFWVHRKVQIVK